MTSPTTVVAIVSGIGFVLLCLATTIWNLVWRREPYLSPKDLLNTNNDLKHINLKVVRKISAAARQGIKDAFWKSPDFLWMIKGSEAFTDDDIPALKDLMTYLIEYVMCMGETYGHIIKSMDDDGNFQGCMILIPPTPAFRQKLQSIPPILHTGKPPSSIWNHPGRKARLNAFGQVDHHHHETMKDCMDSHWYLLTLAVAPSAQGKKVGSRLLQQAFHLAGNLPIFLECHGGNVGYYEKHGFNLQKKYAFEPGEPYADPPFFFNCMRRDPIIES